MNITNNPISQVTSVRLSGVGASGLRPSGSTIGSDQVTISDLARQVQDVKQHISSLPQTRTERVAELKRMIESGTYQSSDRDIASAILSSAKNDVEGL